MELESIVDPILLFKSDLNLESFPIGGILIVSGDIIEYFHEKERKPALY